MKIKTTTNTCTTEIECTAEELRQSNTVADGVLGCLRRAFNGPLDPAYESCEEEEEEESNE